MEAAGNALRKSQPSVSWDQASATVADVTCDGLPETLVVGYQPDKVWLGVVHVSRQNNAPSIATLSFLIGKPTQDSFCAVPVRIQAAPMDCATDQGVRTGRKPIKGCHEFSLVDGACDSLHFYWDGAQKVLTWWRR